MPNCIPILLAEKAQHFHLPRVGPSFLSPVRVGRDPDPNNPKSTMLRRCLNTDLGKIWHLPEAGIRKPEAGI